MASRKAWRLVGAVIILVGGILLIAALLTPWYYYNYAWAGGPAGNYGTANFTYYLGPPSLSGTIWLTCTGHPAWCPTRTSYSNADENHTGIVAGVSFGMLTAGAALGIIAGTIGVVGRGKPLRPFPVITLAVLALVLAIAAPGLFAESLPGAFSQDIPIAHCSSCTGVGPWSSFSGSGFAEWGLVGGPDSWGPSIGWYVSFAAFAVLLVGVALFMVFRKDPPRPGASPSTVSQGASNPPAPPSPLPPSEERNLAKSVSSSSIPRLFWRGSWTRYSFPKP